MAYSAVLSLKKTIQNLLNSSHISIVLTNSSRQIIEPLYEEVCSLQEVLEELDQTTTSSNRKKVNHLDGQIREAVCKLEDTLDFQVSNQFLSQSSHHHLPPLTSLSVDLIELKQEIDSFIQTENKVKADYRREIWNESPEEEEEDDGDDDDDGVASRIDRFDGNDCSKMVGLSDQFTRIKNELTTNYSGLDTITLVGMAGIGKTTLAKKLFQDPLISSQFETGAFVFMGLKCKLENVYLDILKQVDPKFDHERLPIMEGDQGNLLHGLKMTVRESLKDRKYLIVLDDVWNNEIFVSKCFPDDKNGSRVLVTTRLPPSLTCLKFPYYKIRFLTKKESWDLLREKVFGEESCSYELEKAGKKIAENCEGLPLTILKVAESLSKADMTTEYWNEVADQKQHSVFIDAYEQMSEVLLPSYTCLPQQFKPCFLYMGVFPQSYEVPRTKLYNLWTVEGILGTNMDFYSFADKILWKLVLGNLVIVHKKNYRGEMKAAGLHSSFWYMCNKVAREIKFFNGLRILSESLSEAIKSQRRLCIHNSILFGIKDAYYSMASVSSARSLLCNAPYHQYPVPICLESLRLLRILDAPAIRFYKFPLEVLKLVLLTYFSLTYDGELPSSISILLNLRFFIVHRHLSIIRKYDVDSSYLPLEIWDMKELEHLQIMGRDLPEPSCEGSVLPNLLTLLDASPRSCTKRVLQRIPNLEKLGIRIELPHDVDEPLRCFDHISQLHKLKVLKCNVMNPVIMPADTIVAPLVPLSILPLGLEKLTLSGLGYPWEEMSKISSLPNLKVLKLLCYAFRGPTWKVYFREFPCLESLVIEDTDLVNWVFVHAGYPLHTLTRLSVRNCYKLQEIPTTLYKGYGLEEIELVDCNTQALSLAKQYFKEKREEDLHYLRIINFHSSLDDGN